LKLRMASGSRRTCPGRTFNATSRLSFLSRARHARPFPCCAGRRIRSACTAQKTRAPGWGTTSVSSGFGAQGRLGRDRLFSVDSAVVCPLSISAEGLSPFLEKGHTGSCFTPCLAEGFRSASSARGRQVDTGMAERLDLGLPADARRTVSLVPPTSSWRLLVVGFPTKGKRVGMIP
jgi:hypothetical protein